MRPNRESAGRALALMRAGLTRRQLLRVLGISAVGVASTGLLAACENTDDENEDVSASESEDETDDAETDEEVEEVEEDAESVDEAADEEESETEQDDRDSASDEDRPELVVGVQGLPPTLDAQRELSNVGMRVSYMMYDTLIRRDWQGGDTAIFILISRRRGSS